MNTDKESYLQYLPPVLGEKSGTSTDFSLERFLRVFQELNDELEAEVDDIPKLFDPWKTKREHLAWLASWVALELDQDWPEQQQRTLLRHIVSLYRQRSTLAGLEKYLRIYVGTNVTLKELSPASFPHIFRVTITFPKYDPVGQVQRARQIRRILDREKPAHTHYELVFENPTLQIGVHSTIGKDSILGTQ